MEEHLRLSILDINLVSFTGI